MTRIAVVGLGKIALDQHLPVIAGSPDFQLAATASLDGRTAGVPAYATLEALLAGPERPEAVALCQPPQARFDAALAAIRAGLHVLLEKPPGVTVSEVRLLAAEAEERGVALFAAWHTRFSEGVEDARRRLAATTIDAVEVDWREDVRRWHPGQQWIWEPGGLGVFDPGVNALSLLTGVLPGPVRLQEATLTFPADRQTPIAADLTLRTGAGAPIRAAFDWRWTGPPTWEMRVRTPGGTLALSPASARHEYVALYARFAELVRGRTVDVDLSPLQLVADAFLAGRRVIGEPFHD